MWERFGYYGMRALLTLYLTKHFIFGDREATGLYGGFTASRKIIFIQAVPAAIALALVLAVS